MFISKKPLSLLLSTLFTVSAFAQAQPLPPALAGALKTGLKIEKTFPAVSGLTGYVLNKNGEYSIVYATPDNQTVINGVVMSAEGKNMTPIYAEQYIPKPDYDAMWAVLEKAPVVVTGAKGTAVKAVVYAFLDPNCVFCNLAWKAFKPYEKAGLQVRWVPVAFLGPTSLTKAAAILQAADSAAALEQHEVAYKAGGIDAKGVAVKDETRAKLEGNSKLMKELGFNGTPAIVYKDSKSGKVVTKNGMPRLSEFPAMLNLPAIPKDRKSVV